MKPAIPEWEEAITKEYRLAYKDILSEETIEASIVWFISFLEPIIAEERRKAVEDCLKAVTPEEPHTECYADYCLSCGARDVWNEVRCEIIRKGEDYLKTL